MHDKLIQRTFQDIFQIPDAVGLDLDLHRVAHGVVMRQAALLLRLSGMGLRNSMRTSIAVYWASWTDSYGVISASL